MLKTEELSYTGNEKTCSSSERDRTENSRAGSGQEQEWLLLLSLAIMLFFFYRVLSKFFFSLTDSGD